MILFRFESLKVCLHELHSHVDSDVLDIYKFMDTNRMKIIIQDVNKTVQFATYMILIIIHVDLR